MNTNNGCRWCGHVTSNPSGGFAIIENTCSQCQAGKHATLGFIQADGAQCNVWHNPDNSLYVEFQRADGKTSRYTLSEALLLKAGVLKLSDTPLGGRRE